MPRKLKILPIFFALLYVLLASRPSGKEWTVALESGVALQPQGRSTHAAQSAAPSSQDARAQAIPQGLAGSAAKIIPFDAGGKFGYFTKDGTVPLVREASSNVAIDAFGWIEYDKNPDSMVAYSFNSPFARKIAALGYPFFFGGRRFILRSDQKGLSEMDRSGTLLWSREFPSIITAFSANAAYSVVGLLNGSIYELNAGGTIAARIPAKNSSGQCVYGLAVSGDSDMVLALSGLGPQVLTAYKRNTSGFDQIFRKAIEPETRSSCAVGFSAENNFAIVVGREVSLLYDKKENTCIPLAPWILPSNISKVEIETLGKNGLAVSVNDFVLVLVGKTLVLKANIPNVKLVQEEGHLDFVWRNALYRYTAVQK